MSTFTPQDDARLQFAVSQCGISRWSDVAAIVGSKSARQCKERYNMLQPTFNSSEWTPEEDRLLEEKFQEYGPHWAKMLPWFPNRTDVNLKNHWSALLGRKCKMERLSRLSLSETTHPSSHPGEVQPDHENKADWAALTELDETFFSQ